MAPLYDESGSATSPSVSQGHGGFHAATPALGSRWPRPLNCGGADENKVRRCREPRAIAVSQLRVEATRQAPPAGSDGEGGGSTEAAAAAALGCTVAF